MQISKVCTLQVNYDMKALSATDTVHGNTTQDPTTNVS